MISYLNDCFAKYLKMGIYFCFYIALLCDGTSINLVLPKEIKPPGFITCI